MMISWFAVRGGCDSDSSCFDSILLLLWWQQHFVAAIQVLTHMTCCTCLPACSSVVSCKDLIALTPHHLPFCNTNPPSQLSHDPMIFKSISKDWPLPISLSVNYAMREDMKYSNSSLALVVMRWLAVSPCNSCLHRGFGSVWLFIENKWEETQAVFKE